MRRLRREEPAQSGIAIHGYVSAFGVDYAVRYGDGGLIEAARQVHSHDCASRTGGAFANTESRPLETIANACVYGHFEQHSCEYAGPKF